MCNKAPRAEASCRPLNDMCIRSILLLMVLCAAPAAAQTWELVTPVKTRSDLAAVHLRSPL